MIKLLFIFCLLFPQGCYHQFIIHAEVDGKQMVYTGEVRDEAIKFLDSLKNKTVHELRVDLKIGEKYLKRTAKRKDVPALTTETRRFFQ